MRDGREREFLIVGTGAVGLGIGSCLVGAGQRVHFAARPDIVRALERGGLVRTGIFGTLELPPARFEAVGSLDALPRKPFECILVAVKSYDSDAVARTLAERPWLFGAETCVVLFQNGWGNAEVFAGQLARERVFNARVITGFQRTAPNRVEITVHADAIHLGSLFGADAAPLAGLARAIESGGVPCRIVSDIARDLWAKLLYNCALNPLGAILDVPYGELANSEPTRRIMDGIVDEAFAAMKTAGFATHWESPERYLADFYGEILPPTAGHESSMLQDLRAGKRTEIDALNGAVVRLAQQAGVATPINATLVDVIRFLEARKTAAPRRGSSLR